DDDRLRIERLPGRGRGRRLRADDELVGRRGTDGDVRRGRRAYRRRAGEQQADGLGQRVDQVRETCDASHNLDGGRAAKRLDTRIQPRADLGRVVAGFEVAVLVFDLDDRLDEEGRAGRGRRRWLSLDRELAGGAWANDDRIGRRPRERAAREKYCADPG